MESLPELIVDRYRPVRRIGVGGMGEVWEVLHVHTGDRLAMKVLLAQPDDAVRVERFKREARAAAKIKSPHVVAIVDAGTAPELAGAPYLVMELLDGEDLKRRLARVKRLTWDETRAILGELASGLEAAHAAGIVHRDIKPENVFLHRTGGGESVKVLDFGVSRFLEIAASPLTATGDFLGTPFYMSPEQARGEAHKIGVTSDVWAIGLVTFRMLAGIGYWQSTTVADLMVDILSGPMKSPSSLASDLPRGFDAWFARSCHRDPEKRFQSVKEQVAELVELGATPRRRIGWGPPAGIAASIVAVVAGWFLASAVDRKPRVPLAESAAAPDPIAPATALPELPSATASQIAPSEAESRPLAATSAPSPPRRTAKSHAATGARPPPPVDPDQSFLLQYK